MKTLLLAPEIFSSEGGIPRILRLYLKALCELSWPSGGVSLVTLNDGVIDSRDLRRYATERLVAWEACKRHKTRFLRVALKLSRQADLIICGHVGQLPIAWLASRFNRKLSYTLIAHGIEVWRPFSILEKIAIRGAKQIWCVSDFTRKELLKNCPMPVERTLVVPNGLDPFFSPYESNSYTPSEPVILTISRLSQADSYKGIDHLIDAMPAIRRTFPDVRLRVAGRGDDLARLQAKAQQKHLSGAVDFLGYVSDADMRRELSTCRLFALPSKKEGFGLVYLEAMAYGKPCIGAQEGGTPEVISPESGMLAEYGNVPHLAHVCVTALQKSWDPDAIMARSQVFSYSRFRHRLASLLYT